MNIAGIFTGTLVLGAFLLFLVVMARGYRSHPFYRFAWLRDRDLALFSRQLGSMLSMKLPLTEALRQITNEYRRVPLKNIHFIRRLEDVTRHIQEGLSLAQSMARQGLRLFPDYYLRMLQAAEAGDNLPAMLEMASETLERKVSHAGKMFLLLLYPAIVSWFFLNIALFLVVYILPTFTSLSEGMNQQLPAATKVFIFLMKGMMNPLFFLSALASIVLVFVILPLVFRKNAADLLALKIPILGKAFRCQELSHFCGVLSLVLRSGIPLSEALPIAAGAVNNQVLRETMESMALERGAPLSALLRDKALFSPTFVWMVKMGEKTETLEGTLQEMSLIYGDESRLLLERCMGWLKPATLTILGLCVGTMMLAVFLPIVQIITTITSFNLP